MNLYCFKRGSVITESEAWYRHERTMTKPEVMALLKERWPALKTAALETDRLRDEDCERLFGCHYPPSWEFRGTERVMTTPRGTMADYVERKMSKR